jgi:superfamily II DNA or RNA helicase
MSDTVWLELLTTPSEQAEIALVRQLWVEANRIEAALSECRLVDIARLGIEQRTENVCVVTRTTPAARLVREAIPSDWYILNVADTPAPEFVLFYESGSSFPSAAIVFTGSAGGQGWLTYHRRPLILQRLRERFAQLSRLHNPQRAVTAVREKSLAVDRTGPASDPPGGAAEYMQPRQLYQAILQSHFSATVAAVGSGSRPETAPALAAHQERAYERACDIMDRFGGVIIADAVGLGKTYIGLRLLESTLAGGGEGLLVVPAALKDQWLREVSYLRSYSGDMDSPPVGDPPGDNLDLWIRESGAGRIVILTIESLSRKSLNQAKLSGADVVIVDEAHNFRNPQTQRYRHLADLVRHSRVVLLTATPINNTLLDLQHLIALFAAPGAFRHLGINDYRAVFRRATTGEADVRGVVSACVLRRTRRFLRTYYGDVVVQGDTTGQPIPIRFPKRRPTVAIEYDLARTYSDLTSSLDDWFAALHFPSLVADRHDQEIGSAVGSVAGLLKIIMLKRFESSVEAFRRTVTQQLAWCKTALQAVAAGRILTRPDYRTAFQGPTDDPGSQLAFFELVLPVPSVTKRGISDFRRRLEHDAEILSNIQSALAPIGIEQDRKITALRHLLNGELSGRKVLVFTEFRDTARYIHHALGNRPYVARIDSEAAHLGRQRASRREVIERFAPLSNGVREPPESERVEILIATDVLSEGLNLQDAAAVVSYDLPWNPVRLMQRIGRIDRLGAVHEWVELHHFVPARELERLLGLMARLHEKVRAIETALGTDNPVLGRPELATPNFQHLRTLASGPDGYERIEADLEGPFDPEEQAYLDYVALKGGERVATSGPGVSAVTDHTTSRVRAIAYWRVDCGHQRRGLWLVCDPKSGCVVEDSAAAILALRTVSANSKTLPIGRLESNVSSARRVCGRYVARVMARLEAARIAGDALRPGLPQCRIAAWLGQSLQSKSHHLGPETRSRSDDLLGRLARRYTAAGERALSRIADHLPAYPTPAFLDKLEQRLLELAPNEPSPPKAREIGLLLLVPDS